jgi:two-component system response regulator YesN
MDGGDGLEMIAELRMLPMTPEVIVLSGYSEFEYARRCLSLNVRDYLLKPVTTQDLIAQVQRVDAAHRIDADLFSALFEGRRLQPPGCVFLLKTSAPPSIERRTALRRELARLTGNPQGTLIAETDETSSFYYARGVVDLPRRETTSFLGQLSSVLRSKVVGAVVVDIDGDLMAARSILEHRVLNALLGPAPLDPAPSTFDFGRAIVDSLSAEKDILDALQGGDGEEYNARLFRWQDDVFRAGFDPRSCLAAARRLFLSIQNRLKEISPASFDRWQDLLPSDTLAHCLDRDDVRTLLTRVGLIVPDAKDSRHRSVDNWRIRATLELIQSRLASPPSLAECAVQFEVSPEYLSRQFHAEIGTGFARYVAEQRIEKAKALLGLSKESVDTVARSLGFGNAKYFSSVFRKVTGLTPSEYRERMK